MASHDHALPAVASNRSLDAAGAWFWRFLKNELSPYPGRFWVVARMTIAATIVMVIVMTFRIPYGFLGAIYTLLLSRENPTVTFRSGVRTVISYALATVYTVIGVMTLIDDPVTHFLWIMVSFFLAFYLIRIVPDYITAVGFGFTIAGAIPLWDETFLSVNQRTENTLWLGFSVILGTVVTVAVEYVFRRVHPTTDLTIGIQSRLKSVTALLRQISSGQPDFKFQKDIALYSSVGTSRLRRTLLLSGYAHDFVAQMNIAIALLGRLMDLAASLQILRSSQFSVASLSDRDRCARLADQIEELGRDLTQRKLPRLIAIPSTMQPSELPLLPEMERTVTLISHAFSGSDSVSEIPVPAVIEEEHQHLFVADAFTNPDHIKFAIRGGLATLLAYVVYMGCAWPGLSTSVATCIITALSTIGASRQKQFLRLGGAIIGGFVFGMGAQVFLLPHFDSITGFTVLFAIVTAIAGWIGTASPKLSYLGIQLALAFYLINLQEFAIQSSLSIARDRVVGVLLGLMCMWLVFDRLWMRDALQEMESTFARNLRLLAKLIQQCEKQDPTEAVKHVVHLRDQINEGFNAVRAQADAVVFEFGPARQRKLRIRDDIRRWQPALGILLQVQITYLQYLFQMRSTTLPPLIAESQNAFEEDLASIARAMSDEVSGKIPPATPDMQASAAKLQDVIHHQYAKDSAIPPSLCDMITLTQNLASIVAPLYQDIHSTFANDRQAAAHHALLSPGQAQS
jgi:multidrug resistance protein MdtO